MRFAPRQAAIASPTAAPGGDREIARYRHPLLFFALAMAIPWALWFAAAYLSHQTPASRAQAAAVGLLGVAGLFAPALVALRLIWPHADMRADLRRRLIGLRGVRPGYLLLACLLMPASILLAQAVSLLFGYSADQFALAGRTSFSAGIFPGWFLLLLAPLVEELAWHSYGTDSLRRCMNLLAASLLFALYWAFWHLPLSFIKDYYHSNVAALGPLHSLNFALSIVPFVVLMNWLYYKTNRSILVVVVFHITAGVFNESFATHPDSKLIQTALLILVCVGVVAGDRDFFFRRACSEGAKAGEISKSQRLLTQSAQRP
jgi:membrane protease YdiL (CAAX protease family)